MKHFQSLQFFIFIGLSVFLLISCEKPLSDDTIKNDIENIILSDGPMVLGKKLDNPYSVENVKKALNILIDDNQLKSASIDENEICTTHLYVRFLPKNEKELDLIKRDTLLDIYDYPFRL